MRAFGRIGITAALLVGVTAPAALGVSTPLTLPIRLTSSLNATCTAPDGNGEYLVTGCTAGQGSSFVADTMPAPGRFDVRGITFIWPGQSDFYLPMLTGTKRLDSVVNPTAPIPLGAHAGYHHLALLAAGFGDQFDVPYTVTYTDGTTSTTHLWVRDWSAAQSESDIAGIRWQSYFGWENQAKGQGAIKLLMITLNPRKAVRSLTVAPSTLTYAISLTNALPPGGGPLDGPRYTYKPAEAHYAAMGPWTVKESRTTSTCDQKSDLCTIYTPEPFGVDPNTHHRMRHPVVVWANGSGQPSSIYDYFLRHLASWGFVVVASDDTGTGDGSSAADVANYVIAHQRDRSNSWHTKVDVAHIGVAGHSQGGGSVTALFAHQTAPFSAYLAIHPSPSYYCIAVCRFQPSDLAKAKKGAIFYLQSVDDGGAGDTENYYNQTPDTAIKAFGVLAHAKHDDVMGNPHCLDTHPNCITGSYGYLGYSTAWFVWRLRGIATAANIFRSDAGEFVQPDWDWKLNRTNVR